MSRFAITILMLFACATLLSACGHYSDKMMSDNAPDKSVVAKIGSSNATFKDYLAAEYYNLARYEQNKTNDYKAAARYVRKGDKVLSGVMVMPEKPSKYKLPFVKRDELRATRESLIYSLKNHATPENRRVLALAQTRFDCWVDQAEEGKEPASCQAQYNEAMADLVVSNDINHLHEAHEEDCDC